MLLTLKLTLRRAWYLLRTKLGRKSYVVYSTPKDFRRLLLRKHNQRRERGNVALYLGKRRGRYNATA
jgi:hypothetical protein